MDSAPDFSIEELMSLVSKGQQEQTRLYRQKRYGRTHQDELLWMALAPCWTAALAERSGFPVHDVGVEECLQNMRRESLVKVTQVRAGSNRSLRQPIYTLEESVRNDVLEPYTRSPGGIAEVQPLIAQIGGNILNAINNEVSAPPHFAPPSVARWAALAAFASDTEALVAEFDRHVKRAFNEGQSAVIRDWVNAAQPLSAMLMRRGDDSLSQALQRASQQLILLRRRENDERHLKYFYQRREQLRAFRELMRGPDDKWALHLIGAGGVGKTMLVRKVAVDWAKEEGAVTARVDFDFLKADYPLLDPGMLLWAFAQDLRAHAGRNSLRLFHDADKLFERLNKRVVSETAGGRGARRATDDGLFHQALGLYIEALQLIPQRVLLIVDTCEELVKVRLDSSAAENVEETFRILGALHDGVERLRDPSAPPSGGVPGLRVIFSGRRPLAAGGDGWSCPAAAMLGTRPYLRLHEIRGFRHEDAAAFLRGKLNVPADLIPAIVKRSSPDAGGGAEIRYDDPSAAPSKEVRCNPYDLRLYAEWASESPPPTAVEILASPGAAQYVELRIIRRLHFDPLRGMLPLIALLGHFDERILHAVFDGEWDAAAINTAFEVLQQEEWISQHLSQDAEGKMCLILDVEPGLRKRLLTYFRGDARLNELQPRAARYLEDVTLRTDLGTLDWSYFDAALSVIEADPDPSRAARWWKAVEQRILAQRPPEWVRDLTAAMQNEGGAVAPRDPQDAPGAPPESRLRPAVLATHAAALLRSAGPEERGQTRRQVDAIWAEVGEKAHLHPSPEEAKVLGLRAFANNLSSRLNADESGAHLDQIAELWRKVYELAAASSKLPGRVIDDAQLAATLVSAAESVVEYAEKLSLKDSPLASAGVGSVGAGGSAERFELRGIFQLAVLLPRASGVSALNEHLTPLRAFAMSLTGRAAALLPGGAATSLYYFEESLRLSSDILPASPPPWLDWVPPDDIASRVRLEFVRAAYPAMLAPGEVLERVGRPRVSLRSVDGDRLQSALLRLRLAEGPVPASALALYDWATSGVGKFVFRETELTPVPEVCRAHRLTPPLFVTAAEVAASDGQVDEALAQLKVVSNNPALYSYDTLLHVERACAEIIRRMRLRDVGEMSGQALEASPEVADRALLWGLEALDGPKGRKAIPSLPDARPASLSLGLENTGGPRRPGPTLPDSHYILERQERWELRWLHHIWQTRYTLAPGWRKPAVVWAGEHLHAALATRPTRLHHYESASVSLDLLEAVLLKRPSEDATLPPITKKWFEDAGTVPYGVISSEYLSNPEGALTLWLRARSLSNKLDDKWLADEVRMAVERLGRRRAAEVAWREADLLALRLPLKSVLFYEHALRWFGECHDHVGLFAVGTSLALFSLDEKSGVRDSDLSQRLSAACHEIESNLREKGIKFLNTDLDDPAVFPALRNYDREDVATFGQAGWRPRLVRYMISMPKVVAYDKKAKFSREAVEKLLPAAAARMETGPALLPADLTYWFEHANVPRTRLGRLVAKLKLPLQIIGVAALVIVVLYLALLLFRYLFSFAAPGFGQERLWVQFATMGAAAAAVVLAYRIVSASRNSVWPFWRGKLLHNLVPLLILVGSVVWYYFAVPLVAWFGAIPGVSWAVAAGLAAAAAAAYLFYRLAQILRVAFAKRVRKAEDAAVGRLGRSRLKLEVSAGAESPSATDSISDLPAADVSLSRISQSLLARRAFQSVSFEEELFRERTVRVGSGTWPYSRLSSQVTHELAAALDRTAERQLNTTTGVVIDLDAGTLNGLCWESLFQRDPADAAAESTPAPFVCYRRLRVVAGRRKWRRGSSILEVFGGGEAAQALAKEGWRRFEQRLYPWWHWSELTYRLPLIGKETITAYVSEAEELSGRKSLMRANILHLIGRAEETESGVVMRLGGATSDLPTPELTGKGSERRRTKHRGDGSTVRAEDLVKRNPRLSVCIIQDEPRRVESRLEGDRRDAFFARLFASKIYASGVPLVICIPAVEAEEARAIIESLSHVFRWPILGRLPRVTRDELLRTVAVIRLRISRHARAKDIKGSALARELSNDLCVYFDDHWDGRVG